MAILTTETENTKAYAEKLKLGGYRARLNLFRKPDIKAADPTVPPEEKLTIATE